MHSGFEPFLRAKGLAPHSVKAYVKDVGFIERTCDTDAGELAATDLDAIFGRGLSVSRNHRLKHAWNAYRTFAASRLGTDLPRADYAAKVRWKAKPSLEPDERLWILRTAALDGGPDGLAVGLLLHTGMRSEEARTRRVKDVLQNGKSLLVHGKEDKDRIVPIFTSAPDEGLPSAKDIVEALTTDKHDAHFLLSRSARSPEHPWSESRLYDACQRIRDKAQMKGSLNPHRLRRGWATDLRRRGVDIAVISSLLGHGSLDVTLRYLGISGHDVDNVRRLVDGIE